MSPVEEIIFVIFRLGSALVLTGVSGYVSYKMYRRALTPTAVWLYTATILWTVTIFRWFVVWVRTEGAEGLYAQLEPWFQPLTQTMYVLLAMAIFTLTYTHIKERRLHYLLEHRDDEGGSGE